MTSRSLLDLLDALLAQIAITVVVILPMAAGVIIYLAVDTAPSIDRAADITPVNIQRAKRILDQNDPHQLRPGARRTISVNANDLDLAANYLARQYTAGGARVQLACGTVMIGASLKLPRVPMPIYLNVDATLLENGALPRITSLKIGKVSLPPRLAHWLFPHAFTIAFHNADIRSFRNAVKRITVDDNRVALTYEWQADLPEKLRTVLLPADDQRRLRIYQEHLANVTGSAKSRVVSLTELLGTAFRPRRREIDP